MKRKRQQPLAGFLRSHRISLSRLAREANYSRDHITNIREGRAHPSLECVKALLDATSRIVDRHVQIEELFDVAPARRKAS